MPVVVAAVACFIIVVASTSSSFPLFPEKAEDERLNLRQKRG
jgi:hypothetical protein